MSNENSDALKIRRAPSKFYGSRDGEAICLPDGNLHYFATEHEARAFLADYDTAEIGRLAA